MEHVVVVGGSITAVTAARTLRSKGFEGRVTLLSEESHPPYSRIPLSKGVLAGTEPAETVSLPALSSDIECRLETCAVALRRNRKIVVLADGEEVSFDRLVVATGARARRLGRVDQTGEMVLRTVGDATTLADHLRRGSRAIIVGGGFLGMEIATTCRTLGFDVTVVDREPPLQRHLAPWPAALIVGTAQERGVRFRLAPEGVQLIGRSTIEGVHCGDYHLEADHVISAVGDQPNVEWLRDSGLSVADGVRADERCRAVPDVLAAGDVAVRHTSTGNLQRVPHWTNAVEQARASAATLMHGGNAEPYQPDPYFWPEQHGLTVKISGDLPLAGWPNIIQGSLVDRQFIAQWDQPQSAAAVNYKISTSRLKNIGAPATRRLPGRNDGAEDFALNRSSVINFSLMAHRG